MDYKKLNKKGRDAYKALGLCVKASLNERDSEHAIICGSALAQLADAEQGNYFGTEGDVNLNDAHDLCKQVVDLVDVEGFPDFMKDDLKIIKRLVKDYAD